MKFRTEYKVGRDTGNNSLGKEMASQFLMDTRRPVVLLGSCFADNISAKMQGCLWEAENPLGTLYNPMSIAGALEACLFDSGLAGASGTDYTGAAGVGFEGSLFEAVGMWRSWLFDSKLMAETREDVVYAFRRQAHRLDELLSRAEVLFVTFGTAWCYYLNAASCEGDEDRAEERLWGNPVANCHKQPGWMFERRRLTVEEIVERWTELIGMLRERYPGLKVVFTVSPVRHLKDGFEGNTRSKAVLLLATEELCRRVEHCGYFPAYEIVNDDLRDYRFYASDLVHPSDEGVEYIWEKFKEMFLDEAGVRRLKEGEAIRKGLDHRPLPNAVRQPSEGMVKREEERIQGLQERLRMFREKNL